MKNRKLDVIKCPCCGAEYLPAEIYIPDAFFGRPTFIERDHCTSTIMEYGGTSLDPYEHFICNYCNTPFKVVAKIQFFTQEEQEYNFNKDYSTSLKKQSIFLDED